VFGKFPSYATFLHGLNFLRGSGIKEEEVSVLCVVDQHDHDLHPLEWLSSLGTFPVRGLGTVLVAGELTTTFCEVAAKLHAEGSEDAENVATALVRLGLHPSDVQELAIQLRHGALFLGLHPQRNPQRHTQASTLRKDLLAAGAQAVYSRQQNRAASRTPGGQSNMTAPETFPAKQFKTN